MKDVTEGLVQSAEQVTWRLGFRHMLNHLHMTVCFFLLFVAFSSVQNLQTSIVDEKDGFYSLCTIYVSLCFTTLLISGQFVDKFKPKWSIAIGALCYLSFLIANRWPSRYSLLPTAAVLGFGGAILWAAQGANFFMFLTVGGTYLTIASANYAKARSQPHLATMGLFTGVFFAIFQCSQVVGNLISGFVLGGHANPPPERVVLLMIVYISVASVGCIGFLLLRSEVPSGMETVTTQKSLAESLLRVILQLKEKRMALLLPLFFFSGLEQGFVFGSFTGSIIKPAVGSGKVGFIMALFGAVNTLSSLAMGRISDRWGNKPLVITGFLAHLSFYACFFAAITLRGTHWFTEREYLLYLGAAVYGVGDAAANTFPNIICSLYFTDNAEAAFSNLKFFQSLGSVLAFSTGTLDITSKLVMCIGFCTLACISLTILHVFVTPIDVKSHEEDDD